MSKCTTEVARRGIFTALMVVALGVSSIETNAQDRLATFDKAGETHFALSIAAKAEETKSRPSDVVVYVDTSASQTGAYKRDSIDALNYLLKNLSASDRVKIVAVDIDPVALTEGFVAPNSPESQKAVAAINARVPLGTTDINALLTDAAVAFDGTQNNNVIYIGDGFSTENILESAVFDGLVTKLIQAKVSFSSFAIGPQRDIKLLATLANHTGGNVMVDTDVEGSVKESGLALAKTVHESVLWPSDGSLDASVVDMLPRRFPPLRTDRDSIILGTLSDRDPVDLTVIGQMNGEQVTLTYKVTPEASNDEFAFLPGMISDARNDNGLRLPTVGSSGLREFAESRNKKASGLADLTEKALLNGDLVQAEILGQGALAISANPANTRTELLSMAAMYKVQEDDPFAPKKPDPAPVDPPAADPFAQPNIAPGAPAGQTPMPTQEPGSLPVLSGQEQDGSKGDVPVIIDTPEGGGIIMIDDSDDQEIRKVLQGDDDSEASDIIRSVSEQKEVVNQRARAQVRFEISQANDELRTNPDAAIDRLKSMLDTLDQATDLYPETRSELRWTLESSLQAARREKLAFDSRRALYDQNLAKAEELAELSAREVRREELIGSLLNRFNTLLLEENYKEAVDVTNTVNEIAPYEPAVSAAFQFGPLARNYDRLIKFRRKKEAATASSLLEAEFATLPFPGDEIMTFPDADEWREKRERRKKYKNFRLAGSENDEKILAALDSTIKQGEFNFDEDTWTDVKDKLEQAYGINIVLDQTAIDDALPEDELITVSLSGIRLKNALRIMLSKYNATFVVKDEVLYVISKENAEDAEWLVTNVYNVGDIVAPRQNFGGGGGLGGGGFGGGGLGGGLGGGGLGGGLGGGGFGGGGLGGGGLGGAFCIQDDTTVKVNFKQSKPTTVNLNESKEPVQAWGEFFKANFADPQNVRETVRVLMSEDKPAEVVSMIFAAFENDQRQTWMHEALVIAMEVSGQPKSEIERALTSTIDLSSDENDALLAANYMAEHGMERRAIRTLQSFVRSNPVRHEPYVLGLRTALKVNDVDGIMWATEGIFSQEWPENPEVVEQATFAAQGVKTTLKNDGKLQELAAYESRLRSAEERDCYAEVSWTGDADLDIYVVEPGGSVCSRAQKRSFAGGVYLGDEFSKSPNASGVITERYVLPKGFAGKYQLVIKRAWGEINSGQVKVAIYNHYKSDRQKGQEKQIEIKENGATVMFALDRGRRAESLAEHEIRTVARQQLMTSRSVIAQQIDESYSPGDANDYFNGLRGGGNNADLLGRNFLNGNLRRGAVGYAPQIQQFPQGAGMQATASTADRLFVIVSPTPFFQQIGEVTTFNILADADNAQGIAGGLGGGGGGLGGGGGGLGGGGFGNGGGGAGGGFGNGGGGGGFF